MSAKRANPQEAPSTSVSLFPVLALLAAVLFYICFFNNLGALGLTGPDEPRYAAIARAMAETRDWVTPRLNGQPWFEKPVLYYWTAGLTFRIFRVSEFAARIPSALAAALATLVLAWGARRRYDDSTAPLVLLLAPTAVGMFSFARAATPDMLFTACLTGAMCAAMEMTAKRGGVAQVPFTPRIGFGIFLGAATLAKGPGALVLAAGSVALWALVSRRWREAFRLFDPLAIGVFFLTALPWYVLCALRNPDFLRVFFWEHNFERYLTPVFRHEQPIWFFLVVLPLGLVPWTPLLVLSARDAWIVWREKRVAQSPALFFTCWALFPLLFFSFSKSKLPGYILPAAPPLILLMARSTARALKGKLGLARWAFGAVGATFPALAVSAGYWLRRLPPGSAFGDPRQALPWLIPIALGGLVILVLGAARQLRASLLATALLIALLVEAAGLRVLPVLDRTLSTRILAESAASLTAGSPNLAIFRLSRAWKYGLDFYLRRDLPEWTAQTPRPCWVFTNAAGLAELQRLGLPLTSVNFGAPEGWLVRISAAE